MKKIVLRYSSYILITYCIISCASIPTRNISNSLKINYLDEYVFYNDSIFTGSKVGGLSGIEYDKAQNLYYLVCDDAKKPRFYTASIAIANYKFDTLIFDQLILIKDQKNEFFKTNIADLEAIRTLGTNKLIFSSEGSIKNKYNPAIFVTDMAGNYEYQFILPSYFMTDSTSKNKPRHNGVFEGLVNDIYDTGYWVGMELPLTLDGEEPSIKSAGAPARITHFNKDANQADYQFTYALDKLAKDPLEKFGVNGITGLLQLDKNQFLVIERGYAAGYGNQGNTVRIYLCNNKEATNTVEFESLENKTYTTATKELLFDFESIRSQLTNQIVDNIEGITLGPILPNGNQSLILVSDNNFNPVSEQINQFILLELVKTL